MYKLITLIGCLFFFVTLGPGQSPNSTAQITTGHRSDVIAKWKDHCERLNTALLNERPRLSAGERVFLFANLAKIWKEENPAFAQKVLKDAVELASPALNDEPKEKAKKLEWLRKLFVLSEQIDPKTGEQIANRLKSETEAQPDARLQNSTALMDAALAVISRDPKLAFDLAVGALAYLERPSQNQKIYDVILFLGIKDKALSETLLLRVLKAAQLTADLESIGRLALFASPSSTTANVDILSDATKRFVLSVFLESLTRLSELSQQKQLHDDQAQLACSLLLMAKGLDETIRSYLPNQYATVSQLSQSDLCLQSTVSGNSQAIDEMIKKSKDWTLEELIDAGNREADSRRKGFYLGRAVAILSKEKRFERALEILDDMDERTRKALGVGTDDLYWRALRQSTALNAIVLRVQSKDLGTANRLLEKTPSDLRPELQVQVSRTILSKVSKVDPDDADQTFAFALMSDARRSLATLTNPFESVDLFLSLLRRYALLLPDETTSVFAETVGAINRADGVRNAKENQNEDFAGGDDVVALPVSMLEHADTVLNQIEDVQKPYSRVRLKLGLLNASIAKYRQEKTKALDTTSPASLKTKLPTG